MSHRAWCGLLLAVSLAAQWWLFAGYVRRDVAPLYPGYWDQAIALQIGYEGYEDARTEGLGPALRRALTKESAPGPLLPLASIPVFVAFGPSRLHALALNFAAFALLQVTVVLGLRRLAGWPAALLGWGTTWALRTTYLVPGGCADFRADFAALCLYGVFLGAALRSGTFRDARGSAVAGLAAAACVSTRVLTVVYLGLVLAAFAAVMLLRSRGKERGEACRARCRGAVLAAVVMMAGSAPALVLQRHAIEEHYFRGILGPMRTVRARWVGADTTLGNLAFYPRSLLAHTGPILPALGLAAAGALAFEVSRRRKRPEGDPLDMPAVLLLGLAFVVPLAILTVLTSKSTVVGAILTAPLLWAIPLAAASWQARRASRLQRGASAWLTAIAVLVAVAGAIVQFKAWRLRPLRVDPSAAAGVFALQDTLAGDAWERGLRSPLVSVDHMSDALNSWAMNASTYERRGRLLQARMGIGSVPGLVSPESALSAVRASDYVVLMARDSPGPRVYPADISFEGLRESFYAYCEGEMRPAGRFRVPEGEVLLFARR